MRTAATAALLLAAAQGSLAALKIHNWCNAPIYFWEVQGADKSGGMTTVAANSIFTHNWIQKPDINLKMATKPDPGVMYSNQIAQFEYSWTNTLAYDYSIINGNPFGGGNVKVTPTGNGANAAGCKVARCNAGQAPCPQAYNIPTDDKQAMRTCPTNVGDVWLDLCEPTASYNTKRSVFQS